MPCPYNVILGRDTALPSPNFSATNNSDATGDDPTGFDMTLLQLFEPISNCEHRRLMLYCRILFGGKFLDRKSVVSIDPGYVRSRFRRLVLASLDWRSCLTQVRTSRWRRADRSKCDRTALVLDPPISPSRFPAVFEMFGTSLLLAPSFHE